MAVVDFFKRKRKKGEEKPVKIEVEPEKSRFPEIKTAKAKISVETDRILKTPHLSEKATGLAKKNQYVFKVWPRANKSEIKKAVEDLYGVEVEGLKIINVPRRKRRLGRISGWRKGFKKAIVKIKEGQRIEVMPK